MVVVLILGGIQLLSLGIIGEYLGRFFVQTKNRPNYLIEESRLLSEPIQGNPVVPTVIPLSDEHVPIAKNGRDCDASVA